MPIIPKPIVLSIAGHDPSGGAGIQADIETLSMLGCHAATCITCLTVQDSRNVYELVPLSAELITRQAEALFQDLPIGIIKLGLIGSAEAAIAIARLLRQHPEIPVVLDPVLAAGGGTPLASQQLIDALIGQVIPNTLLITPNSDEARRLTGQQTLDDCAAHLLSTGCGAVLITGTHEASEQVVNRLYRPGRAVDCLSWPRLEGSYHGSGCTIASAIAAGLACGAPLEQAVEDGQRFTWNSLSSGWRPGKGQRIPDRFYLNRSG